VSAAIPKVSYGQTVTRIKQGDTLPILTYTTQDENQQMVPITGATGVQFRYCLKGADPATAIVRQATILAADQGQLTYAWIAADTAQPGTYNGEWIVAFPNGGQQTFPVRGYQPFVVEAKL